MTFRRCLPPEHVLAVGLYRLAHGNSYNTIGPVFNIGKTTVIQCVEDAVEALNGLRDLGGFQLISSIRKLSSDRKEQTLAVKQQFLKPREGEKIVPK